MNAGKVSCALAVHPQAEQFLSNWEVYLCLAQFKAKDAWTLQLDACRAAAQVAGSCREQFATDQELNRHVTVFRSLARNFKLTAKAKPELAKLFEEVPLEENPEPMNDGSISDVSSLTRDFFDLSLSNILTCYFIKENLFGLN